MASDGPPDGPSTVEVGDAPAEGPPEPLCLTAWVDGREVGRLALEGQTTVVGRAADCNLVIDHPTVSHRHLEVQPRGGGLLVRDLGARNGIWFQGSRVGEAFLRPGAVLRIGSVELRIEKAHQPAASRLGELVSTAPAMRAAIEQLAQAAPTDATVLLLGETGVGKELAAQALHEGSPRVGKPFTVIDCGALPRELAGSELFGHVKGAFTGADRDRSGVFEQADGGTVFLDEIGELPLDLQPLLLRVLEDRKVRRIGDKDYRSFDVRVVAATNRDLEAEVEAGRFRRDLLYRLAVVKVVLPPLRERREDLPMLVRAILDRMGGKAREFTPSPELLSAIEEYDWPGNVRELRNVVERAVVLSAGGSVDATALGLPASAENAAPVDYRAARARALEEFERSFVVQLLKTRSHNISRAARDAGIARVYLHRLMRKHRISPPEE